MSGAKYITWDGDPGNSINPHRPSAADCGGNDLLDDTDDAPAPDEPGADGWNQKVSQVVGQARVTTAARIEVRFTAGTPAIYRITGPRTALVAADLDIFDDGAGVVRIKDTNNKLPARAMAPGALTILDDGAAPAGVQWGKVFEVASNEIRIRLFQGTAPTDLNFRVDWD